jgi:hypothetical protein
MESDVSLALRTTDDLLVIETEDDIFLGAVFVKGNKVTLRTGYRGRPKVLDLDEIESVTLASEHPDVVAA